MSQPQQSQAQQPCAYCSRMTSLENSLVIDGKVYCQLQHYLLNIRRTERAARPLLPRRRYWLK